MEQLKGPNAGTFMPKRVYDIMNQKTEEVHNFANGLLPDSNVKITIAKLEQSNINHFYIPHNDTGHYACSKGHPSIEEGMVHA